VRELCIDEATNGDLMATIRREIEVQASPRDVSATWDRFIRRTVSDQYKLACDESACVNAVESGTVAFAPVDNGATRVVFQLELPDDESELPRAELAQHMTHDLIAFKDYVTRGEPDAGHPSVEEEVLLEKEAGAHGDKPRHVRLSAENSTTFWRSHFPT
jgi:hypothetical protein